MAVTLISSPLQSYTEHHFRNGIDQFFGGIDVYYAPYIRLNGKLEIKASYQRDLEPKNNKVKTLIPQVMTNDPDEFVFVAEYVKSLGYTELNWNLGCPYPMVTKRCMGSGLITETDRIRAVLERVYSEGIIDVSMKMRLGYTEPTEIIKAFAVLNDYPLKSVGVHARLGKQLYKGGVDLDGFEACLDATDHLLYYNGDITTVEVFRTLQARFPTIEHWMIGRGLLQDPFLAAMIKANETQYPADKWKRFRDLHDSLFDAYAAGLSGRSHVLTKMASYWEYFAFLFEDPHKTYKRIKKAKSIEAYHEAVFENLRSRTS